MSFLVEDLTSTIYLMNNGKYNEIIFDYKHLEEP